VAINHPMKIGYESEVRKTSEKGEKKEGGMMRPETKREYSIHNTQYPILDRGRRMPVPGTNYRELSEAEEMAD